MSRPGAFTIWVGGPFGAVLDPVVPGERAEFIRRIEFLAIEEPGYWEKRGYSSTADPWINDRFGWGFLLRSSSFGGQVRRLRRLRRGGICEK